MSGSDGDPPIVRERRVRSDMAEELWARTRDREVRLLVGALPEAQRAVLVRRWGLVGKGRSVADVAAELGLTEAEVREFEEAALDVLAQRVAGREDLGP